MWRRWAETEKEVLAPMPAAAAPSCGSRSPVAASSSPAARQTSSPQESRLARWLI